MKSTLNSFPWSNSPKTFSENSIKQIKGAPVVAQWLMNPTRNHEVAVWSLALLSGWRIQRCRELWCGSQTRLGSRVVWLWRRPVATAPIRPLAWAWASGYSPDPPPSRETSICRGRTQKKKKKNKKKKKKKKKLTIKEENTLNQAAQEDRIGRRGWLERKSPEKDERSAL